MAKVGERKWTLLVDCPADMAEHRAVNLDKANNSVTYTPAGEVPDALTVTKARRRDVTGTTTYTIEIVPIKYILVARYVALAGTVVQGDALEVVGTEGKFQKLASGLAVGLYANGPGVDGEYIGAYNLDGVAGITAINQLNAGGFKIVSGGIVEVTLSTSGATTNTGITISKTFAGLKSIVSEDIVFPDAADHHYQVGVSGTADKYIDKANGSSSLQIDKNVKEVYDFDPSKGKESAELVITLTGGISQTPTAGKVQLEVLYFETEGFEDLA